MECRTLYARRMFRKKCNCLARKCRRRPHTKGARDFYPNTLYFSAYGSCRRPIAGLRRPKDPLWILAGTTKKRNWKAKTIWPTQVRSYENKNECPCGSYGWRRKSRTFCTNMTSPSNIAKHMLIPGQHSEKYMNSWPESRNICELVLAQIANDNMWIPCKYRETYLNSLPK